MTVNNTRRRPLLALAARGLLLLGPIAGGLGCSGEDSPWRKMTTMVHGPVETADTDTFTLRQDGLVQEKDAGTTSALVPPELAAGREAFRREEYDKAESLFARVADYDRNAPVSVQEALYYKAECLRLKGEYPKAADTYNDLLNKYPNCAYREQAVQHMFTIARFWLQDTYAEMLESKEKAAGSRWFVTPRFVSFEKSQPLLDREGRAIEKLEQVRMHDFNGPVGEQALFLCGVVKMYREDYREADHFFSEISNRGKDGKLAEQALEMAIKCKHLSTGGSDYDGRKTAEARKLIQAAFRSYPNLSRDEKKREFLQTQLKGIDLQQAEKDFKMAEFYQRIGKYPSAYWYYDMVQKSYPGTPYAQKAAEAWAALRAKVEADKGVPLELKPGIPNGPPIRKEPTPSPVRPAEPEERTLPQPTPVNPATLPTPMR